MIYRFSEFVLDTDLRELRKGSELRKLARKSFDLLCYLLEHHSRVVHKHELIEAIWPGERVTPTVLPVAIRGVREALDEGGSGEILRTVRGRGYRIVCAVESDEPASRPSTRAASLRQAFVGRAFVMSQLCEDLERAIAGSGRAALLLGEPGIGKTRVLDELARSARQKSIVVLHARCPDDVGAPPFWPIQQWLDAGLSTARADLQHADGERDGFDPERARAELAELFVLGPSGDVDFKAARTRLARAVVEWLIAASDLAPMLLLIDDLHWADEGTLHVFEAVLRALRSHPIACVAAYRTGETRPGISASEVIERTRREPHVRAIEIEGFDLEEIEAFIHCETGAAAREGWVVDLRERTNGNPFFLRETLRLLVAEGRLASDSPLAELGLPQGVREAVGRRLSSHSPACVEMLAWASVIGRHFSVPVLRRVCELHGEDALDAALCEARAAQIIAPLHASEPDAAGEYGFVHHLIRETIYEGLTAHERVLRHRAVAEAIEALHGSGAERVFDLARHFFESAPAGDIDRAVNYCLRAARLSRHRYAPEAEARHVEQALRAEELRKPVSDLRYCCLIIAWGVALWRAGRYSAAEVQFQRAAEQARALGRYDLLGHCALGLAGWPSFNRLRFGRPRPEVEHERVAALAREALQGLGDGDRALRARLLGVQVRIGQQQTPPRVEVQRAEQALALARESGDARAVFHALLSKITSLAGPADVHAALALASEAVAQAERLGAPARTFAAHEARIPLLLTLGDMAQADADIDTLERIAARLQVPAYSYAVARFRVARALGDGDLPRTRELLARVRQLGDEAEDPGATGATRMIEFWMLAVEGRSRDARSVLTSGAPSYQPARGSVAALTAYFWMLADDRAHCAEKFEHAAQDGFSTIRTGASWLWHMATCADVCAYLQDRTRAEQLYALILPYRELNVTSSIYCYRGSAALALGQMASLIGRRDEAAELFERALEFNQRIGAIPSVAWAQLAYARMLRRGDTEQQRRAQQLFQAAEGGMRPLGLVLNKVGSAALT